MTILDTLRRLSGREPETPASPAAGSLSPREANNPWRGVFDPKCARACRRLPARRPLAAVPSGSSSSSEPAVPPVPQRLCCSCFPCSSNPKAGGRSMYDTVDDPNSAPTTWCAAYATTINTRRRRRFECC